MTRASVTPEIFAELARTRPLKAATEALRAGLHARRLLLLKSLLVLVERRSGGCAGAARSAGLSVAARQAFDRDWALLEQAERVDRAAVRAILDYPTTGAWLAETMAASDGPRFEEHLARFGGVAVAAVVRAGCPADGTVAAPTGILALPGLGTLNCPSGRARVSGGHAGGVRVADAAGLGQGVVLSPCGTGTGVVRVDADAGPDDAGPVGAGPGNNGPENAGPEAAHPDHAGRAPVGARARGAEDPDAGGPAGGTAADGPAAGWAALSTLPGSTVVLDDLDPYRVPSAGVGPAGLPAAERPHSGGPDWARRWQQAQRLLTATDPERAAETASVLRAVVPLAPPHAQGVSMSATLRAAPGAVLTQLPDSAEEFAVALVHEAHHTKLAALHESVPLCRPDGTARHRVGWRADPRPVPGVLQGAYAHLALTDLWSRARTARGVPGAWRRRAGKQFDKYREPLGQALSILLESDELTVAGREFVRAMARCHARLGVAARNPV